MSARTLADIARLAGVSRTTASYVINGQAEARRISPATVERVEAVVAAHHFQVDARAAALRRGETRTLGLVVPDLENASYARLAKRIERGARQAGYQVIIVGSDDDPLTERSLVNALRARRCDGLIVASCLQRDDEFYDDITQGGLPVIGLDRPLDETRFRSVASSNTEAARQLTASVLTRATRTLLWLDAVPGLSITERRRHGFRAAVAEHGGECRADIRTADAYDRASGARLLADYLAEHPMPDALLTAAYPLLDGALDVLLAENAPARGLPRAGTFGDDRVLDFLPMAVNSLPQQHDRIAEIALDRMWSALGGEGTPGHDRVQRILKCRTRPVPSGGKKVPNP
ncbi:catabolite repressor/activator [Salinisphaera hydrothermalis]|uniref:catabolite repressor/activator n=1 Tax=Salinisphaera hydrothermalis TaxID=563188 RepID=UPI0033402627